MECLARKYYDGPWEYCKTDDARVGDIICDDVFHYKVYSVKINNYILVYGYDGKCPGMIEKGKAKIGDQGQEMTFETFRPEFQPEAFEAARKFSVSPDPGNLIIAGSNGTGKSHLASAVKANSYNTQDVTAIELRKYAIERESFDSEESTRAKSRIELYKHCPRLIVDDLGAESEKDHNDLMRELLYEISDYRNSGTMWITNLTSSQIENRYGARTLSRMQKNAAIVSCVGTDFRSFNGK